MTIQKRLAIALMTFLVPMAFASTASAQAGSACSGTVCGLGGQVRGQIGEGLPLPISFATARTGPFVDITIQTQPATTNGAALVGNGLGQPGQVKPTTNATIMQTTASPHTPNNPRNLTIAPNMFAYDAPEGSVGLLGFNSEVLAVQSNLIFDSPHPGTTEFGAPVVVPGGGGSRVLSAGGRAGLSTVTFCALATGSPGNNFGGVCAVPADGTTPSGAGINGIARFTRTANQFGGTSTGRTLGTAKVYLNVLNLPLAMLPCNGGTNQGCAFGISTVVPSTLGIAGGAFGGTANNPGVTGMIYTGSLGFNGTILSVGNVITNGNTTFMGQPNTSVGFPLTTGMLTISVSDALPVTEVFIRTGTDARTANGNGVIALNTGSMSKRTISRGNSNRTWITYEIPEPSAIFAASAGLFALFGCHQLARRRR